MRVGRTALQAGRILVLLFLLRATGWFDVAIHQAQTRLQLGALWGPWAATSLVSLLFVGVMLVSRRHWHPWVVLGVEAILAGVLAFVPLLQWVIWFGIGRWSTMVAGNAVRPLAVAWLGVVAFQGIHQLRDPDAFSPSVAIGADTTTARADDRIISWE